MASIKVGLRKTMIKKDGINPLALRENYKKNHHWLGHYVLEDLRKVNYGNFFLFQKS